MIKELLIEIRRFFKGSTVDAIMPGLLFVILQKKTSIIVALIIPVIITLIFLVYRVIKKEQWFYSIIGLFSVIVASLLAYFGNNSSNYFLPDILGNFTLFFLCFISLITKKPLAAWVSHLSRGWHIKWFWRKDVLPAYMEATGFWLVYLFIRLVLLIGLYLESNVEQLFLYNIILGAPMTIAVLSLTYLFGISRLRKLGGPGVDEYMKGKEKPWIGQRTGF